MHQLTVRRSFNAMVVIPQVNQSACIADLLSRDVWAKHHWPSLGKGARPLHDTTRHTEATTRLYVRIRNPQRNPSKQKRQPKKNGKQNKQGLTNTPQQKTKSASPLLLHQRPAMLFKHRQEQTPFPDSGTISQPKNKRQKEE